MITVFTPAYNRADLLPRLYDSLKAQTCKDFEWIVVDDGSTDGTEAVVRSFLEEGLLDIRYFRQENGGKHRAINRGVKEARGELFFIIDSDDYIKENAISSIINHYSLVSGDKTFAGVCAMKCYDNGKRIGGDVDFIQLECNLFRFRHILGIKGDISEICRTDILRDFPFPEIEGENFCPEAIVLYRISQAGYKFLYYNECISICEYIEGGLSDRITEIRIKSPVSSSLTYYELWNSPTTIKRRIRGAINFWRFYFHCAKDRRPSKRPCLIFKPIGYLLYIKDKR